MSARRPDFLVGGTIGYIGGVDPAVRAASAGTVQVYHTDALGSVRALTDGAGTVIQTYQTDPFGVPSQTQGSSTQPFQYTGQQRDGNGLIYLRARYDDPTTGRFLSRDVLSGRLVAPQTLNRYAYASNNPVVQVDPSGQEGVWEGEDDLYLVGSVGWHGSQELPGNGVASRAVSQVSRDAYAVPPDSEAMTRVRDLGRAGEEAAKIAKNTERIRSLTRTANYRVPDVLDRQIRKVIGDVKNVRYLRLTNQLKDFLAYADQERLTVELYVRQDAGTKLSATLQDLAAQGKITIKRILP